MSNFLAVAAVTASLSHALQAAVGADVPGATVTTVRPDASASATHPPVVNLFLYQVLPNAALRNADVPTRRSDGSLVDKPVAALDLHYLLTFYGDDAQLQPQRLLGSAVRTLHSRPVLTRELIQAAITDPTFAAAVGQSDLGQQIERVKVTPLHLSLEELSKLWSVFFQTPYALSAAYHAAVVLIEAEDQPTPPNLPVRLPHVVASAAVLRPLVPSGAALPRPTVTVSLSNVTAEGSQRTADVTVHFETAVRRDQRVVLLLSRTGVAGGFTFAAPARATPETNSVTCRVTGVPAGSYVVRAQVDGAESLPTVSAEGQYDGPRITL
ncbi:MAG TPA: DUF4255 domain-containing protein [Chloroflexota bacterium]